MSCGSGERRVRARSSEGGTVTAEFAVVLPVLALVGALCAGTSYTYEFHFKCFWEGEGRGKKSNQAVSNE